MSSENYYLYTLSWTFATNTLFLPPNPDCHVEMHVFHGKLVLSLALELEPEIVARQSVNFIPLASVQKCAGNLN